MTAQIYEHSQFTSFRMKEIFFPPQHTLLKDAEKSKSALNSEEKSRAERKGKKSEFDCLFRYIHSVLR